MTKLREAVTGAVVQREQSPYEKFRAQVERLRPEIAAMTGKENVDRFVRVCLNAVQANPAVLDADRRSLLLACMRAAQDGLLPDGREAVFNVYRTKVKISNREEWVQLVQYLPMVGGLVRKLYDSGHVTFVDGVAVREKDEFTYERGDAPRIVHKPYIGADDPGKVIAAYAVIKLRNGETKREVMSRRDIELVKSKSKAQDGLMWGEETGFYDQAAIKSVIKRAYKQLPSSIEVERVIASDNEVTGLVDVAVPITGAGDLQAIVDGRFEQEQRDQVISTKATEPQNATQIIQPTAEKATEVKVDVKAGVKAEAKAGPTEKEKGTPELKQKYKDAFAICTDSDVLAIKMDETKFYTWLPEEVLELEAAYNARLNDLNDGVS